MPTPRRSFDKDFKLQVLREIEAGSSVAQAARQHGVHPELIYRWKHQLRKYGDRSLKVVATAILMKRASRNWNAP